MVKRMIKAEKAYCRAARGDYMAEWNGEKTFEEVMDVVNYDETDLERAKEENNYPELSDETEAKLISFIKKQLSRGHYGPMEQSSITFAVKGVPVFTERQLIRHRHLTFDVQSMRYADFSDAPYTVPKSMTDPDHFSREQGLTDISDDARERARELYKAEMDRSFEKYKELRELGIPKEDARGILGLGTEVNLTVSGNARTFLHLLDMRRKANAQRNIRELSEAMLDELFDWCPYTFNYYDQNGPNKLSP